MSDWDEIQKLARQIKSQKLKKMVLDFLNNPTPSHGEFKALLDVKKAPAAEKWHHPYVGGLLKHTLAVTRVCLSMADSVEKTYGVEIDRDSLIAGGLCHDIMKIAEYTPKKGGFEMILPLPLDHLTLAVTELYYRGFPKKVIHMIAAHHGEAGPILPSDIESMILHFADMFDAYAHSEVSKQ